MSQFIMKPKVDFAFKEIMTDEKARTGFLAAVLHIHPGEIRETHILNANLRKQHEDEKLGILDVRILLNDDTEADVEIQLHELDVWPERSLFYLSKMYTQQIAKGQQYDIFKKCVSISILGYKLFREEREFYSCFHIREDTRNFLYTDKMEFHIIELPKLSKEGNEGCSSLELWARFIAAEEKEELDMIAKQDAYIQSAYDRLEEISQDKQKRMEYEARQKALFDHNQFLHEAEQRGIRKGIEQGRKDGIVGTVAILRSLGMNDEKIVSSIMEQYGLSRNEAAECL